MTDKATPAKVRLTDGLGVSEKRSCTCHPDDKPPIPCAQKYALGECRTHAAAYRRGYDDALNDCLRNGMQWAIAQFDSAAPPQDKPTEAQMLGGDLWGGGRF